MTVATHASEARLSSLGLVFLAIASIGWGLNFPIMKASADGVAAGRRRAGGWRDAAEPLGLREIAALIFTLGGIGIALRA